MKLKISIYNIASGLQWPLSYTLYRRDYELLQQFVTLAENPNEEEFIALVREYDSIQKLDDWKAAVMVKVKQAILRENIKDDDLDLT